jgi:hypothetical protein
MPFEPGNQAAKDRSSPKPWADALRLAISEAHAAGGTKLRALAERTVNEGLAGNMAAIKEIGDRLDGRAAQPIVGSDGGDLIIKIIKQTYDEPASDDSGQDTEDPSR